MRRDFPQSCVLDFVQQQTILVVPVVNVNNGRGHSQDGQGGNQRGRGGWGNGNTYSSTMQPSMEVAFHDDKAQHYAFLGKTVVEASDAFITCTILVSDGWLMCYFILVLLIFMCLFRFPWDFI